MDIHQWGSALLPSPGVFFLLCFQLGEALSSPRVLRRSTAPLIHPLLLLPSSKERKALKLEKRF